MGYKDKFTAIVRGIERLQLQGMLPGAEKVDTEHFFREVRQEYSQGLASNVEKTRRIIELWRQENANATAMANEALSSISEPGYDSGQIDIFIEKAEAMADILYVEESAKLRPIVVKQVQKLVKSKRILELLGRCSSGVCASYPLNECLYSLREMLRFIMGYLIDNCEDKYGKGGIGSFQAKNYRDRLLYRAQVVILTATRVIKYRLDNSCRFTAEDYNKCRDLIKSVVGIYDVVGADSSEIVELLFLT